MTETGFENSDIPPDQQPLRYVSGEKTSTGKLVFYDWQNNLRTAEFDLHEADPNIKAFIEYERTFGRGHGRLVTHTHSEQDATRIASSLEGYDESQMPDLLGEYNNLARTLRAILISEDEDAVDEFTQRIKEFRVKYSWLYPRRKRFNIVED